MTIPIYKIEVYDSSDTLIYTIENDVLQIHVKEILTDNVGTFSFAVPTVKGLPNKYYYNDISLFDKVKIWLGYREDGLPSDPITVGKISSITAPLSIQSGYIRVFSGMNQGEVLKRRFKTKRWQDTAASTIVTELANDLGLGTGQISTDTTALTLHFEDSNYLDVLKAISDYWYDASTQLKYDFYVDVNNNLVWHSRPIRTSGVETLTVGDNIISYNVFRDVSNVYNYITVFGERNRTEPSDADSWTESLTNWTATQGTLSLQSADIAEGIPGKKAGSYSINCTAETGESTVDYYRSIDEIDLWSPNRKYSYLRFWDYYGAWGHVTSSYVRLVDVDGDYFQYEIPDITDRATDTAWQHWDLGLGPSYEYDSEDNPDGLWTKSGTPNWQRINKIRFVVNWSVNEKAMLVDGLHFAEGRYRYTAEDSSSQTNYGKREYVHVDDALKSDSECEKRARTLLYQLKDPPIRLDVATPGNTNIKIGDRLTMNIPAEGLSSTSFDVVSVEHSFSKQGFITQATMINTADLRVMPPVSTREILKRKFDTQRELGRGIRVVK